MNTYNKIFKWPTASVLLPLPRPIYVKIVVKTIDKYYFW